MQPDNTTTLSRAYSEGLAFTLFRVEGIWGTVPSIRVNEMGLLEGWHWVERQW